MAWSYVSTKSVICKQHLLFSEGVLFEDNNYAVKLLASSRKIGKIKFKTHPTIVALGKDLSLSCPIDVYLKRNCRTSFCFFRCLQSIEPNHPH